MALFIEIKAADGLASRTRLEAGNNRFTVRLGDSYRIFDDQTGIAPTGMAVKRVDNNLIVDGLGKSEVAAGGQPTTVEFAEFYSVCSAGSPCELVVDQGPGGATVAITPGTQPIGALADGSFVLYDPNYAENAPATPPLGDDATLRYALYGLGGAAVLGLAAGGGGGGGGGDDGAGTGTGPDGTLKLTSSTFTNSRTPTITGQGEPGAKVTVRIDTDGDGVPNVTYGTTVAPDFTWSINLANAVPESGALPPSGLPDASNVGVTSTTAGGVASLPTFVLAFDNTPPAQPVVNTIAGDNVVNAAEKTGGVVIAGTAEAGATVTVTWGSQVRTAVADGSGNWQTPGFDSQSIPGNGPGTITAVVQDLAGNNSAPVAVAVTVNTSPAKLTLASGNEAINANEAAAGITLGGTTDPNAVVTVTWNNAAKPAVTADGNGGWSVPDRRSRDPAAGHRQRSLFDRRDECHRQQQHAGGTGGGGCSGAGAAGHRIDRRQQRRQRPGTRGRRHGDRHRRGRRDGGSHLGRPERIRDGQRQRQLERHLRGWKHRRRRGVGRGGGWGGQFVGRRAIDGGSGGYDAAGTDGSSGRPDNQHRGSARRGPVHRHCRSRRGRGDRLEWSRGAAGGDDDRDHLGGRLPYAPRARADRGAAVRCDVTATDAAGNVATVTAA